MAQLVTGPNDPSYPHVQQPVLGDRPGIHPPDCNLQRPGHRVRPINAWHRCHPRSVLVTPPPPHDWSLSAFEQVFLIADDRQLNGDASRDPVGFVVHNPEQLREKLEEVDGCAIYGWPHNSLWMKGLSCNSGFNPCFTVPYPCSPEMGRDGQSPATPYVEECDELRSARVRILIPDVELSDWWQLTPLQSGIISNRDLS